MPLVKHRVGICFYKQAYLPLSLTIAGLAFMVRGKIGAIRLCMGGAGGRINIY